MTTNRTPGPWLLKGDQITHKGGNIASVWSPRRADETRLDGESWIDMRERTQSERDAIEEEMKVNAYLITSVPDLLDERDRLKAANAELAEALEGLTEIIENAGLQNLVHGVQLGRISWLVKATDCVTYARAALAQHDKEKS